MPVPAKSSANTAGANCASHAAKIDVATASVRSASLTGVERAGTSDRKACASIPEAVSYGCVPSPQARRRCSASAIAGVIATLGTLILLSTTLIPNLAVMYVAGSIIGVATGLFMTANWALGAGLAPRAEAGRYLGISNLAGAGAGMIGAGIGGPIADWLNRLQPGMGYFAIFACYAVLFLLSALTLLKVRAINNTTFTPDREIE